MYGKLSDEHRIWLDNSKGSGEYNTVFSNIEFYLCFPMLGEPSSVTRDVPERTSDQLQYPGKYLAVYIKICSSIDVGDMCTTSYLLVARSVVCPCTYK